MKILVVDDDARVCETLRDLLVQKGHEVECAADGAGALSAARSAPAPAVMILDLMMPGMSGLEVLKSLGAAGESVPTVVLVSAGEEEMGRTAMAAGARAFLTKPVDPGALEPAVVAAASAKRT